MDSIVFKVLLVGLAMMGSIFGGLIVRIVFDFIRPKDKPELMDPKRNICTDDCKCMARIADCEACMVRLDERTKGQDKIIEKIDNLGTRFDSVVKDVQYIKGRFRGQKDKKV